MPKLSVSYDTANKILHKELMNKVYHPPAPHRSVLGMVWSKFVSFFHLDAIHISRFPTWIFLWLAAILVCTVLIFMIVSWVRAPKAGREMVNIARRKMSESAPALQEAQAALTSGLLSDFLACLVKICVEYALQHHFVRNIKPGQTVRVLEREIARTADSSFSRLFHDIRIAAESVHFAHRQVSLQDCTSLFERVKAVYEEGVV